MDHPRHGRESAFSYKAVSVRHEPVAGRYRHGDAMFLPHGRAAVTLFIAILYVIMYEGRLVETLHGIAYGAYVARTAAAREYRLAKTRPQSLAAAPHEFKSYVGYAHLPNTSISM